MENKLKLPFCEIIADSNKSLEDEKEFIIKAFKYNQDFFKIEIPNFIVRIVSSRQEFDKLWGEKTEDYVSAFARDNVIVIFSYESFEKETRWKKDQFYECLVHEINHLFYEELRDDSYDPLWLSEGLATFMQHSMKKYDYKNPKTITKEILEQDFEEMTLDSYQVFTMFVEYLILYFGEDKLKRLIKGLKEGRKLNDLFQEIYTMSFEELIKNGNQYQATS